MFKALLLKEAGFSAIVPDMIYLSLFAVITLSIATPLFKRTLGYTRTSLFQSFVLGFGIFEDGNVGIRGFPEIQKILVGGLGAGSVAGERASTR